MTCPTTINPLYILLKKAIGIITFSHFDMRSSPRFKKLNIKLPDTIKLLKYPHPKIWGYPPGVIYFEFKQ